MGKCSMEMVGEKYTGGKEKRGGHKSECNMEGGRDRHTGD